MTIHFQAATERDAPLLLALVEAYYELDLIPFDAQVIRQALAQLLTTPALGGAWLIREGEAALGYFILTFGFDLEFGGRQATVTELYLAPEHRRRGIGTQTLQFVETTLRALGISAFELQAERHNVKALACYAKFGMTAHDRIPLSKRIG